MKTNLHLSRYWSCQLIGWSTAALYWGILGYIQSNFRWDIAIVQFTTDIIGYIILTHLYRNVALKNHWGEFALVPMVKRLVPAIVIMGLLYTALTILKIYWVRSIFKIGGDLQLFEFAGQHWPEIFMAGLRLMSIWLLAYHLYHYAQRELKLANKNSALALSFKQSQLDNLSAQLNPHFLFNSLNTIKALVNRDPDKARRGIDLLGELLRNGLYHGSSMMVSLEEEINLVKDYIELEQLRMEDRLTFNLVVDKELSTIAVPRLCLQTLVENAVKHGIATLKKGGEISVTAITEDGFLKLQVKNTGKLDATLTGNGIGLQNLKERIDLAYANRANFKIHQHAENIVVAELNLPLS